MEEVDRKGNSEWALNVERGQHVNGPEKKIEMLHNTAIFEEITEIKSIVEYK